MDSGDDLTTSNPILGGIEVDLKRLGGRRIDPTNRVVGESDPLLRILLHHSQNLLIGTARHSH